jgi:hypothetical protein
MYRVGWAPDDMARNHRPAASRGSERQHSTPNRTTGGRHRCDQRGARSSGRRRDEGEESQGSDEDDESGRGVTGSRLRGCASTRVNQSTEDDDGGGDSVGLDEWRRWCVSGRICMRSRTSTRAEHGGWVRGIALPVGASSRCDGADRIGSADATTNGRCDMRRQREERSERTEQRMVWYGMAWQDSTAIAW